MKMETELLEKRIIDLEIKLSYIEDFSNQIQELAVEQSKTIDLLHKEMKIMATRIKDMSDQLEGDVPNRKPPHY